MGLLYSLGMLCLPTGRSRGRTCHPGRPRIAALTLVATVVMTGGCARPDLGLDHDYKLGGTTGSQDGGGEDGGKDAAADTGTTTGGSDASPDSGGMDAAGTTGDASGQPDADAGCADDDGDTVCNADDNCPGIANPEQDDVCSCDVSVSTATVTAESSISSAGYVGEVDINGSGSNVVAVAPGASVEIAFSWAATQCYFDGMVQLNQHIVMGFEQGGAECAVDTNCSPKPSNCVADTGTPCQLSESESVTLTAPDAPGEYYILMDHEGGTCSGWPDGVPGADQRVAAICVR